MDLWLYPAMLGAILLPAFWFARHHEPVEALARGAGLGVIAWGAIALARFFLLLPSGTPQLVGLAALTGGVVGCLLLAGTTSYGRALAPRLPTSRSLLVVVAACGVMVLGLEASLPHYGAFTTGGCTSTWLAFPACRQTWGGPTGRPP